MNLFFKKISIFLTLLVLLNLIIFLPTNYLYNNKYINNVSGSDKSVFLLSDSHGHSLGKFTETYNVKNLATQSDSYVDMYRKLKFINKTTKVKKIYLSIGSRLFSEYRDVSNNNEKSVYLLNYSDYDSMSNFLLDQYIKRFFIYPTSKQHAYFTKYLIKKKLNIGKNYKRSIWEDLSYSERALQASKKVEKYKYNTISKTQITYLKKIITSCKKNNIELVCVKFPLTKEFMSDPNFSTYNYSEIPELKSLKIIDYNKIYFGKTDFFKDQDHLSKKGAEEFSKILFSN